VHHRVVIRSPENKCSMVLRRCNIDNSVYNLIGNLNLWTMSAKNNHRLTVLETGFWQYCWIHAFSEEKKLLYPWRVPWNSLMSNIKLEPCSLITSVTTLKLYIQEAELRICGVCVKSITKIFIILNPSKLSYWKQHLVSEKVTKTMFTEFYYILYSRII